MFKNRLFLIKNCFDLSTDFFIFETVQRSLNNEWIVSYLTKEL